MNGKLKGVVSHHTAEIAELRADCKLAVAYLSTAIESLSDPETRQAGLLMLRTVAEAFGGLDEVAYEAGISRRTLCRALSPNGNPTLTVLLTIAGRLSMRLSIAPLESAHRG